MGRRLLSQAAAFGPDLVIMSAYGHSHLSDWMCGGVTRTVLCECRHVHESLQSFVAISAEHLLPQHEPPFQAFPSFALRF
jgi:hypothetical protein